jgi:hypothetical protein
MSLNEKLAEALGAPVRFFGDQLHLDISDPESEMSCEIPWNPTTDLNQLRECYLAAKATEDPVAWYAKFREALAWGIRDYDENNRAYHIDFFEVWVDRPELVAQAILKAKGVEV